MPYRNKSDRKKQVNKSPDSPEFRRRMARQEARREMDRTGKDANKNGKADKREGKDVSHNVALARGGTNKDGVKVESASANRSRNLKKKKSPRRLA